MAPNYSTVTDYFCNIVEKSENGFQNKDKEIIISFTLSINNIILRKKRGPKKWLNLSYELLEIIRSQRETNWNWEGYVNLYVNLFS